MSEQAATEQLMAHIEALIVEHDRRDAIELVQGAVRSQIAINTQAELENGALREFVAADDELRQYEEDHSLESRLHDQETCEDWYVLQDRHWDIRQRLATEHGLPLPGAGEAS